MLDRRIGNTRSSFILAGLLLIVFSGLAIAGFNANHVAVDPLALDLTGVWKGNDGGTYYIRQSGDQIWWFGQGSNFGNVFRGQLASGNSQITGQWADVPIGQALGSGSISLVIVNPNKLRREENPGNFTGTDWTREGSSGSSSSDSGGGGGNSDNNNSGGSPGGNNGNVTDMGTALWVSGAHYITEVLDQKGLYKRFRITCLSDKGTYQVTEWWGYGTGRYTMPSSVCVAAVHDGRISYETGGTVTIEIQPGLPKYVGSYQNGLKSHDDDDASTDLSFVFVDPPRQH